MAIKTEPFQGFEITYGTSASDNDRVSIELASANDFWFHAAGYAGSHVIVRNPQNLPKLPKEVEKKAAEIAILHSKAKTAKGKVEVHKALAKNVSKPRGLAPGKVILSSHQRLKLYPPRLEEQE